MLEWSPENVYSNWFSKIKPASGLDSTIIIVEMKEMTVPWLSGQDLRGQGECTEEIKALAKAQLPRWLTMKTQSLGDWNHFVEKRRQTMGLFGPGTFNLEFIEFSEFRNFYEFL